MPIYTPTLDLSFPYGWLPQERHPALGEAPFWTDQYDAQMDRLLSFGGVYASPPPEVASIVFASRWHISASVSGAGVSYGLDTEAPALGVGVGIPWSVRRGISFTHFPPTAHFNFSITPYNLAWSPATSRFIIPHLVSIYLYELDEDESSYLRAYAISTAVPSPTNSAVAGVSLSVGGVVFPMFHPPTSPAITGSISAHPIEWKLP